MRNRNKEPLPLPARGLMIVAGFIAGAVLIHFFFMVMEVKTDSMEPTLKYNNFVFVSKFSAPGIGDIAAYKSPSREGGIIISRIIAGEYDTVELRDKTVYINNERFTSPHHAIDPSSGIFPMRFSTRDNMPPVKLDRGEYFMLSDNFDRGYDSRYTGPVKKESITGKIIYTR